jgi:uncharacterized protein YjeT (DUF2065 family)
MWNCILLSIALCLFYESVIPFLSPPLWRRFLYGLQQSSDAQVRLVAFLMLLAAAGILVLIHLGLV